MTPGASAAASYRDVATTTRILSAQGPELTAALYLELLDTLRRALRPQQLARSATRALNLLGELDAWLGADRDDDFARRMQAIHRHASRCAMAAIAENDPKRCYPAIEAIAPIAEAWGSLRSSA